MEIKKLPKQGFTLVELLVAISVFTTVVGIGISLYISLNNTYDKADSVINVTAEGNRIMEKIARSVKNAWQIADDSSATTLHLIIPSDTEGGGNLEYTSNGRCTDTYYEHVDTDGDSVEDQITKTVSNCEDLSPRCGSGCSLTNNAVIVSSLNFTLDRKDANPDSVTVSFKLERAGTSTQQRSASLTFTRTVSTRGY